MTLDNVIKRHNSNGYEPIEYVSGTGLGDGSGWGCGSFYGRGFGSVSGDGSGSGVCW